MKRTLTEDETVERNRRWLWRNVPLPETHLALMVIGIFLNVRWPRPIASAGRVRRVGGLIVILGAVLAAWATWTAGRVILEQPERLITRGPYAVSRHPMYVAWTLIYFGTALVINTLWMLILLPLLAVLIHREAQREESRLEEAFGEVYRTYQARVRRYL